MAKMTDSLAKCCDDMAKHCAADLPSSDDETGIDDKDTCSAVELAAQFNVRYTPKDESVVSLKNDYVLSLCADKGFTRIAAGLSNTAVQIFDLDDSCHGITKIHVDRVPQVDNDGSENLSTVTICGVHFLDDGPENILVGTTDGIVRLFDLRASGEQARFEYIKTPESELPPVPKSISCFDRNANGRIICTGMEQYMNNAYLLFYDVRERKQLGAYYESHQDDVTSVLFHRQNPDLLCSGSTDGLINVYNIKETDEDEALLNTINTESSVSKLNWHRNVYEQDVISCITHTNDFKSYECQEGDELTSFDRENITASIRRKNVGNFNLINAHNVEDGGVFLLAGTNSNRGEVLRSVSVVNKQTLKPLANYVGNKQIVRESIYDPKRDILVTGGESGIITVWTSGASADNKTSQLKTKSKTKSHKATPY